MVAQPQAWTDRDQVRYVPARPLVSDIFHEERWIHVFVRQRANSREIEYRRMAVFFEDGKMKARRGISLPRRHRESANNEACHRRRRGPDGTAR